MSEASRLGKGAGQTIDLVAMLRKLIRDYPPGLGIAKELIQNADDAGASWIRFTLDLRQPTGLKLPDPRMTLLAGPALLIQSNQTFTDNDLQAIQTIAEGSKHSSAAKTGRFGLGFNTAYNVTDYPAFATRDLIMCFDPHEDAVAHPKQGRGWQWNIQEMWQEAPDWPALFGLTQNVPKIDFTVFRLPLRDARGAQQHRISQTPFTPSDAEHLFDDIEEMGTQLLLFTRHLLKIELCTVSADGRREDRFFAETLNAEEVESERIKIHQPCVGDADDVLKRLAAMGSETPRGLWLHEFGIKRIHQGLSSERWLLACGLELGENGELLSAAQKMADIDEKAVPLAGAAIQVTGVGTSLQPLPCEGRIYCSLPLPSATGLKFHINGYFDLDSARTQISHDEKKWDNADTRRDWNRILLQHAVPLLIGDLMTHLVERMGDLGSASDIYELLPDLKTFEGTPLAYLGRSLYAHLAEQKIFRTRTANGHEWRSASECRLASTSWSEDLRHALSESGLEHLDPQPPTSVIGGLQSVKESPSQWTPLDLATWLKARGLPSPLPLYLTKVDLICELLWFLLSNSTTNLAGIPLAVNGELRLSVFSPSMRLHLASQDIRELLSFAKGAFVHEALEQITSLTEARAPGLKKISPSEVIQKLGKILPPLVGGLPWAADGSQTPNTAWLTTAIRILSGKEYRSATENLTSLSLIPDQYGTLRRPGQTLTPLIPSDNLDRATKEALGAFRIPLVTGGSELQLAIRTLKDSHADLVWSLTGADVVDTLADLDNGQPLSIPSKHREAFLTWLAQENERAQFSKSANAKLRALAVWPSLDGRSLYAADTPRVYLSTGYEPPEWIGKVHFLNPGPQRKWQLLLGQLGVHSLSRLKYILEIFLPSYPGLSRDRQVQALAWLKEQDIYEQIHRDEGADSLPEFKKKLASSKLILGEDGEVHSPSTLLHPDAKEALAILGPSALVPDMSQYGDDSKDWLKFFESLGMRRTVQARDLLRRAKQLAETGMRSGPQAVRADVATMLRYCSQHSSILTSVVEDGRKSKLGDELRSIAWLCAIPTTPVPLPMTKEEDEQKFDVIPGLVAPDHRMYRPTELSAPSLRMAIASQRPIADGLLGIETSEDFFEQLGLQTEAEPSSAIAHLNHVKGLWEAENHGGLSAEEVGKVFVAVFTQVGRSLKTENDQPWSPSPATRALAHFKKGVPCVWDKTQHCFRSIHHVYSVAVPYFGPWRTARSDSGDVGRALDHLGRKKSVTSDDYITFLLDLQVETRGRPLTETEMHHVLDITSLLAEDVPASTSATLPLPSGKGELRPASLLLLNDAPWWTERLREQDLPWLDSRVSKTLALRAGVLRASMAIREELLGRDPTSDSRLQKLCSRLTSHMSTPQWQHGLKRLIQAEGGSTQAEGHQALQLCAAGRLLTGLTCSALDMTEAMGVAESPTYAASDSILWVASSDPDDLYPALAERIQQAIAPATIKDTAALEAILRVEPPDRIHVVLDKRKVPALPDDVARNVHTGTVDPESEFLEEETPPQTDAKSRTSQPVSSMAVLTGMGEVPPPIVATAATRPVSHAPDGSASLLRYQATPVERGSTSPNDQLLGELPIAPTVAPYVVPSLSDVASIAREVGPTWRAVSSPGQADHIGPQHNSVDQPVVDSEGGSDAHHTNMADYDSDLASVIVRQHLRSKARRFQATVDPDGKRRYRATGNYVREEEAIGQKLMEDVSQGSLSATFDLANSIEVAEMIVRAMEEAGKHPHIPFSRKIIGARRQLALLKAGHRFSPPRSFPSTASSSRTQRPRNELAPRDANSPPTKPGTGRNRRLDRRSRLRSYLVPPNEANRVAWEANPIQLNEAIDFAMSQDRHSGCEVMNSKHAGSHFSARNSPESELVHVLVKPLPGAWDGRGLSLSPYEFDMSRTLGDSLRLYVVENSVNPAIRRLFRIPSPASRVVEHRLDDGWKALALIPASSKPAVGMRLLEGDSELGQIEEVISGGKIVHLRVKDALGDTKEIVYRPKKHILQRTEK